jgi:hypothetical protein
MILTACPKGKILPYRLTKPENVTAAKTCAYLVMYKLVGQPHVKTLQWKSLFRVSRFITYGFSNGALTKSSYCDEYNKM